MEGKHICALQRYVDYAGNNKIKKNGVEIEWK